MNNNLRNIINVSKAISGFVDVIYETKPSPEDIKILKDMCPKFVELTTELDNWTKNICPEIPKEEPAPVVDTSFENILANVKEVPVTTNSDEQQKPVHEDVTTPTSKQRTVSILKEKGAPTPLEYIETIAWWVSENYDGKKLSVARKAAQNTFMPYISYQTINCAMRQASHKNIMSKYYNLDASIIRSKHTEKPKCYVEFWKTNKNTEAQTIDMLAFIKGISEKYGILDANPEKVSRLKKEPFVKDMPDETYFSWTTSICECGSSLHSIMMDTSKELPYTKEELFDAMHVEIDLRRAGVLGTPSTPLPEYLVSIMICEAILSVGRKKTQKIISYVKRNYAVCPLSQQVFQVMNGSYHRHIVQKLIKIN